MRGLHPNLVVLAPVLEVAGAIVLQEGPSLVQPPGNRHQAGQEGILQREIFNIFTDILGTSEQLLRLGRWSSYYMFYRVFDILHE